jgi:hypothetical protein
MGKGQGKRRNRGCIGERKGNDEGWIREKGGIGEG